MVNKSFIYYLLSLVFIIVNLITLNNLFPWIDEVMMLDTSYNTAFHGAWETTAWYRVAGQYPFSTYPPLYQMLAAGWMWLFGSSLVAVRSLNLLISFVLGRVCLQLMKRHGLQLSVWPTVLFTFLLWGTSEMAWMYRNGRPDMLCALMVAATVLVMDDYLTSKSRSARIAVVIATAVLLCSGIQAAVYLCALWFFLFIMRRQRRREYFRLFVLLLTGFSLGILMVASFMMAHGRLVAFVSSIVQYSTTLSDLALAVLPWAGETFGFDAAPYAQKLLSLTTKMSFGHRLLSMAEYRSFLFLSAVTLTAYVAHFRNNLMRLFSDKGFLLLILAFYAPIMMVLAGRFPAYYRWMAFLPLLGSIMSIAVRNRWWCAVLCVAALLMSVSGIRSMLPDGQGNYGNLHSFVQRQRFKSSDVIVCPFSMFYEIKPVCDTCYFAGVFPTEYIRHVDYIVEAPDGDSFDKPITDYVGQMKADTTLALVAIDHCEHPSLTLYQVRKKHE